ncbi:quinol monooxygenase YgiN [Variovorax boronicumulans]|uniref:putative quinol monooxygenase n=1 Tax=Variovorax boronicumulans TaxID=436515 RepID=UPI00277E3C24|nr:putative quinol monooxygenase [Variovorax boronicumulans]MDQ0083881.1 quinol monooxygenase YgiN [Variovorax boronicumulans]
MSTDLVIVALVQAKPGQEKALVQAQSELVQVVRKQRGCISYELHEAIDQPGKVVFFERWLDRTSWERHMRGAHMDAFRASASPLIGAVELLQLSQVA